MSFGATAAGNSCCCAGAGAPIVGVYCCPPWLAGTFWCRGCWLCGEVRSEATGRRARAVSPRCAWDSWENCGGCPACAIGIGAGVGCPLGGCRICHGRPVLWSIDGSIDFRRVGVVRRFRRFGVATWSAASWKKMVSLRKNSHLFTPCVSRPSSLPHLVSQSSLTDSRFPTLSTNTPTSHQRVRLKAGR